MEMLFNIALIITTLLIIVYMFPLALVQGNSMYPYLKNNQVLITRRVIFKNRVKVRRVYVYHRPNEEKLIIKRLTEKYPYSNDCYFLGDNPEESYDSRDYGYVKAENIIAVLLWNTKYQLKSKGEKANEKRV